MTFCGVQILGKELRWAPTRARNELRARTAAAAAVVRHGAAGVVSLEAPMVGQDKAGSAIVAQLLQDLGVPEKKIFLAENTTSTRGEAIGGLSIAQQQGWQRMLVITSAYHVPRARRYFEDHFPPGTVAVHAPEALLRWASPIEREWIRQGTPSPKTMSKECNVEALLSSMSRLIHILPNPIRWQVEVKAGALLRGVDERALAYINSGKRRQA